MSKTTKLIFAAGFLLLVVLAAAPASASCPAALPTAMSTPCFLNEVQACRDTGLYKERHDMIDNGDGTMTVAMIFTPRCYDGPTPCMMPTLVVTATVDCATRTATCP